MRDLLILFPTSPNPRISSPIYIHHPANRRPLGPDSLSVSSSSLAANRRSSVADLQSLYRTQITTLWSSVSGSQKFVPLVPGRHVVAEASTFVELNPATYKVKNPVRIFLLECVLCFPRPRLLPAI